MNEAGTEVYFNQPKTIEAMAFWRGLATEHHASPDGVSNWGDLTPDFLQGNAAIIQFTTGGLPNFRAKATFPFGVAGLAGKNSPHTVVGGGNLYFFKNAAPAERAACAALRSLDQRSGARRRLVDQDRLHCHQSRPLTTRRR